MGTTLSAFDIAIRLILTLIAGGILGLNRIERDRPAGLRTIMLVTLAASVAMIEANLLLNSKGKSSDSFAAMDVMRLPLGILSGIGFIGAGTILRRGSLVVGVTTAATLWISTVIGLCLGGGQLVLGSTAALISAAILWCLRWAEPLIGRHRHATLIFAADSDATEQNVRAILSSSGYSITPQNVAYLSSPARKKLTWDVGWITKGRNTDAPEFLSDLAALAEVSDLEWSETPSHPS